MRSFSEPKAFEIIKAGIESETIKLLGNNTNDIHSAEQRAKADAAYLLMIFSELMGKQSA